MATQREHAEKFLALHVPGDPLLLPNPWDVGSAQLFVSLGFSALATTSSGYAATLGRRDGQVTRDEALAHSAAIVGAGEVPVSADLEHGFGDDPDDVVVTVEGAIDAGLAGCSIEDSTGRRDDPIYRFDLAVARIAAAVEAAHRGDVHLVITARAENLIRGRPDLADTIARLQAFEAAGADVLFAPGLRTVDEVRAVVDALARPVNVLTFAGGLTVPELADAGVARVSVGGGFSRIATAAAEHAARSFLERGTFSPAADQG
jgi:2-methylisocitrate lyase-like PEP mutase family enzyme